MAEVRRSFGLAVRIFRERRDWTQARLGKEAQVDAGYVSRIEAGGVDPGLQVQRRLADALGVTHAELLQQAEEEERRLRRRPG